MDGGNVAKDLECSGGGGSKGSTDEPESVVLTYLEFLDVGFLPSIWAKPYRGGICQNWDDTCAVEDLHVYLGESPYCVAKNTEAVGH